jgi:long-chain acyl-CoA synthetase
METLAEVVQEIDRLGSAEAVRWSNGLRTWTWTYRDLYGRIASSAAALKGRGICKGDRVMIWAENRPEWIAVFWAAVVRGVEIVPVDYRFSADLVKRIIEESQAKLLVYGETVEPSTVSIAHIAFDEAAPPDKDLSIEKVPLSRDDIVELVYTSGTTGAPKGVVHRHRNICSNLQPFWTEINKYKKWARPFQPIRILNLLPLSHMFGQSMGLFIPVVLGGSVAFTDEIRPSATVRLVHQNRISVIVSVPRILETFQNETERRFEIYSPPSTKGLLGVAARWWRYRRIHSEFGWKFWAFVVGGARVDSGIEDFWTKLGYAVIQGYGLTEASPVVAVNHPFDTRRGSLGKVVPGQEVKIASDGEILVRGESVTGERGGWLATGDLGEMDSEGRLYYRGRKKDMIVTPEGLNIHPEDVELVLNSIPGVRESTVIAGHDDRGEHVHAALLLKDPDVDPGAVVGKANERLEAHQRIRGWTVWPSDDFPRTESTMKVRRHEVANQIARGVVRSPEPAAKRSALDALLERKPDARLAEDLGLSSLERVELLSEMEGRYGLELDEDQFSRLRTVGEIRNLVDRADRTTPALAATPPSKGGEFGITDWPQYLPVRAFRLIVRRGLVLPLFQHYLGLTVEGLGNLQRISPPAIFAANHTSHLDTIALVAALPPSLRRLLAPAMSKDYFRAWFEKGSWTVGAQYFLARSIFNTYALPQRMSGVKAALEYTALLVQRGYCPLVFPEGVRTPDGSMLPFRPGIGLMAVRLQVPVVPVLLTGLYEIYSVHDNWPKTGPVRVIFGQPLRFGSKVSIEDATMTIEKAVRDLQS